MDKKYNKAVIIKILAIIINHTNVGYYNKPYKLKLKEYIRFYKNLNNQFSY